MKCFRPWCQRCAPYDTLYRVNAKGKPGIWACNEHRIEPDMELDVILEEIERYRQGHAKVLRTHTQKGEKQ